MNPTIRLLYAEDNPQDADLTRAHFAEHAPDFDLQVVATGAACLEQVQRSPPDLLLLDHQLPDTEGVEVLKALHRQAPDLPVVMVTGAGREELVLRALRLGAATYVPKHGNYLDSLPNLLREVLAERGRKRAQGLPGAAASKRVLYVEHLPMDIDLTLQHFAEHAPYLSMDAVHTCAEALARLARPPVYDLVLVDLRMPDQGGLDFVREAKLLLARLPPFIMISGTGDEETAVATLKLGAADYIVKREGYLNQLPFRIDLAIANDSLARNNEELRIQLAHRKQAEEQRLVQEQRLGLAAEFGGMGLWDLDLTTKLAWRTLQHDRLFGYDELQPSWGAEDALRHVVPEDRPIFQHAFDEAFITGIFHYELRIEPKNGPRRWIEANGRVSRDDAGRPVRMAGTVVDITERKRLEEGLKTEMANADAIFESSPVAMLVLDETTNIVRSNGASISMMGGGVSDIEQHRPGNALRCVHSSKDPRGCGYSKECLLCQARNGIEALIASGGSMHGVELQLELIRNGEPRKVWMEFGAEQVVMNERRHLCVSLSDITERKLAEEALGALQAELALTSRLAALGTLVAGVAHEINNPLAAALSDQEQARGAVGELRDRLRGSGPLDREAEVLRLDEVVEELDEAQEAGRRIARIVNDLKLFGRPSQKNARARIRLIDVVDLAMRWLPVSVGQTATVTVENGGAPDVMATAGQITQVVVNLVTNAANATPEGTRGAIVIRIGVGEPGMARLEVIDHGKGIEPAVMSHIFEPFFTTRDVGKGMGLGLSICHSIVVNHGGTLTATSEVGKGSTFRVELPAATEEA